MRFDQRKLDSEIYGEFTGDASLSSISLFVDDLIISIDINHNDCSYGNVEIFRCCSRQRHHTTIYQTDITTTSIARQSKSTSIFSNIHTTYAREVLK